MGHTLGPCNPLEKCRSARTFLPCARAPSPPARLAVHSTSDNQQPRLVSLAEEINSMPSQAETLLLLSAIVASTDISTARDWARKVEQQARAYGPDFKRPTSWTRMSYPVTVVRDAVASANLTAAQFDIYCTPRPSRRTAAAGTPRRRS